MVVFMCVKSSILVKIVLLAILLAIGSVGSVLVLVLVVVVVSTAVLPSCLIVQCTV